MKGSADIFIDPKSAGWFAIGARTGTDPRYDNEEATETTDDPATEIDESLDQTVTVNPAVYRITAVDLTKIKDDGLTADITSIREDDGSVEVDADSYVGCCRIGGHAGELLLLWTTPTPTRLGTLMTEARSAILITLRDSLISQF